MGLRRQPQDFMCIYRVTDTIRRQESKYTSDLWLIDKLSCYEYFATYVNDIPIWSKNPLQSSNIWRKNIF
jgi:hypothetical protein